MLGLQEGDKEPAFQEVLPGHRAHSASLAKGIKDTEEPQPLEEPSLPEATTDRGKEAPRTKLRFPGPETQLELGSEAQQGDLGKGQCKPRLQLENQQEMDPNSGSNSGRCARVSGRRVGPRSPAVK